MAEALARIFGTEEDRVNCSMFYKVGACRNGDHCPRFHNRPAMSQTIMLSRMYAPTPEAMAVANEAPWDPEMYMKAQMHFETFYVDVFNELANFGEIEDMIVADNLCDHLIGNVYVKYYREEAAQDALQKLAGRFYRGQIIQVEYTTVTDFREARCRGFHETHCSRGPYCNFVHIKHVPKAIKARVVREMYTDHPEYLGVEKKKKRRSRSRRRRDDGRRAIADER